MSTQGKSSKTQHIGDDAEEMSLVEMAAENPLGTLVACQYRFKDLEKNYNAQLTKLLAGTFAGAWHLRSDPSLWKDFIKDSFWNRRKKKPRRDKDVPKKLLLSFKFALGACGPGGDKRAWYYTAALQRFFDCGVKPEEVEAEIARAGGITRLYHHEMKTRREARFYENQNKADSIDAFCSDLDREGSAATPPEQRARPDPVAIRYRDYTPFRTAKIPPAGATHQPASERLQGKRDRVRLRVEEGIRRRLKAAAPDEVVKVRLRRLRNDEDGWMLFRLLPPRRLGQNRK